MPGLVLLRGEFQVHLPSGGPAVQRDAVPGELPAVELFAASLLVPVDADDQQPVEGVGVAGEQMRRAASGVRRPAGSFRRSAIGALSRT